MRPANPNMKLRVAEGTIQLHCGLLIQSHIDGACSSYSHLHLKDYHSAWLQNSLGSHWYRAAVLRRTDNPGSKH